MQWGSITQRINLSDSTGCVPNEDADYVTVGTERRARSRFAAPAGRPPVGLRLGGTLVVVPIAFHVPSLRDVRDSQVGDTDECPTARSGLNVAARTFIRSGAASAESHVHPTPLLRQHPIECEPSVPEGPASRRRCMTANPRPSADELRRTPGRTGVHHRRSQSLSLRPARWSWSPDGSRRTGPTTPYKSVMIALPGQGQSGG